MAIKGIEIENFTVFKQENIEFEKGINVFVGENGLGKTHIMKLLYSACQSTQPDVSFSHKVVRVFLPEGFSIQRLVRRKNSGGAAKVNVLSDSSHISLHFSTKTKKWEAEVMNEDKWEMQNSTLTSVFIPAKEILSNSYNLREAAVKGNVEFDDTYLDIIASARVDISRGPDSSKKRKYLDTLKKINEGKVLVDKERFYLQPGNQAKIEFNLVAEGIRKIALLWQLIKNGTLEQGSVLFWDEPEANINPKHMPVIAEMLLMLQRDGVQIFVSTHDYFLAKYLDIKKKNDDSIAYFSFYAGPSEGQSKNVKCEKASDFTLLEHNAILETFRQLYRDEVEVTLT